MLLLDEPTATLSEADASRLFDLLRVPRASRARDGLHLAPAARGDVDHRSHRVPARRSHRRRAADARGLDREARGVSRGPTERLGATPPPPSNDVLLKVDGRVSFELKAGEILGLAGLVGAGRTSVLSGLFGARQTDLSVSVRGKPVSHPLAARR